MRASTSQRTGGVGVANGRSYIGLVKFSLSSSSQPFILSNIHVHSARFRDKCNRSVDKEYRVLVQINAVDPFRFLGKK